MIALRRSILITALLIAALPAAAANIGEWTAGLLRDVTGVKSGRGAEGKYHVLVLYRANALDDADLRHPEIMAREVKAANALPDLYQQMEALFGSGYFHCVVVADLLPQQVVIVEQFARDYAQTNPFGFVLISLIADTLERGRMPFVFDPRRRAGFVRKPALGPYILKLKTSSRHPLVELDSAPPFDDLDRCVPLEARTKGEKQEVICTTNAFKVLDSPSRDVWVREIVDLEVAALYAFDERLDYRKYERAWGRDGYHPHVALAGYLSKLGDCAAVTRELLLARFLSTAEQQKTTQRLQKQCSSIAAHVASGRVPPEAGLSIVIFRGDAELLPPFQPPLVWGERRALR
jgi:hypothetical protein